MLGGLFGVVSRKNLARDLFFGVDYHSHMGTEVGGLAYLDEDIKVISCDISNSQFKSAMQKHYDEIRGVMGIGVISSIEDEQPLKFEAKIGTFALCTAGFIRNSRELYEKLIEEGASFNRTRVTPEGAVPNQTELVGEIISRGKNIMDGIETMYREIDGTISLLLLSKDERCIYASGDAFPLVIGNRGEDWAVASETSAFPNLDFKTFKFLERREIVSIGENGVKTRGNVSFRRKFCPFLHVYFGFPSSDYYGINAEVVRERCGGFLAENDDVKADLVLGVADSGFAHAIGYVKRRIELAGERIRAKIEDFKHGKISLDELQKFVVEEVSSIPPLRRPLVKY
ncbi:MAG: hypothetical protein N3E47_07700, partial [Candidatus Bathyarchaeota archaeon]|nr:hypothetical protein [Candidatus Bathyarchaeota archaeon]